MKKIETTLLFKDEREKFEFFLLAALYGIIFFNFLIWTNLSGDYFPKPDFHLFILSWSTCPAFGLISAFFLRCYREGAFPEDKLFFSRMICMNSIAVLLLLQPMINWHPILRNGWILLLSFVVLQGLGLGLAKFLGQKKGSSVTGDDPFFLYRSVLVFFAAWLLALHSLTRIIRDWGIPNYLFFAAIIFIFYQIIPFGLRKTGERSSWEIGGLRVGQSPVLYSAVFLLIACFILDPHFRYQWYHGSYYLGPLADLLAGKSLMVDINAQYGILVFYFLKLFFYILPVGFTSLSFVITLLIIAQYCLFYFILRQLFRSEIYSFFFLVILILVNHFASVGWATVVPSVGPLRFGFIYSLAALVILRNQHPAKKKMILILESAVVAAAFFWSFEVCLYTVPAYLVFLLYENSEFEKDLQIDFPALFRRLGLLGALISLVAAAVCLDIFLKSGQWPHVSYYLQYVFLYQGGFGMMQRPGLDYWCLVIGMLYLSLWVILGLSLGRKKENPLPEHFNVMALLTFYGILQYMYFIYRSHWNNLFHISMPSLLLFAYWLNLLRSSNPVEIPSSVKKFLFGLGVFFIGVYTQTLFPAALVKIKDQRMPLPQMWERVKEAAKDIPREDGFARKADALMRKYSGDKKALPYFFSSNGDIGYEYRDYGLEVALYTGRVKNLPYNDVSQTCINKKTVARVLSFDPKLQPGDYIYTRPAVRTELRNILSDDVSFENRLVDSLFSRYVLKFIEKCDGVAVYQVKSVR